VDVSGDALEIAKRNAARLQLRNVRFERGSWFAPLAGRRFDVIAANPPYVTRGDADLAASVSRFEPEIALISGANGLEAIEHIAAQAGAHLKRGGSLILEHGWTQGVAVRARLVRSGFAHVRSHADLAGHERVTEGSLP
jgi:release factor glutamine methyltransferase